MGGVATTGTLLVRFRKRVVETLVGQQEPAVISGVPDPTKLLQKRRFSLCRHMLNPGRFGGTRDE
eukprot:3444996-Amphidinium_carterae.2